MRFKRTTSIGLFAALLCSSAVMTSGAFAQPSPSPESQLPQSASQAGQVQNMPTALPGEVVPPTGLENTTVADPVPVVDRRPKPEDRKALRELKPPKDIPIPKLPKDAKVYWPKKDKD